MKSYGIIFEFLKTVGVALLLSVLLFAGGSWQSSAGFIGSTLREITAVLRDAGTQWMVFVCLGIYFTAFLFLRSRGENIFAQRRNGVARLTPRPKDRVSVSRSSVTMKAARFIESFGDLPHCCGSQTRAPIRFGYLAAGLWVVY